MTLGLLLLAGFGLALAIEGLAYALAPNAMRRMIQQILTMPAEQIRTAGLFAALVGAVIVYAANAMR